MMVKKKQKKQPWVLDCIKQNESLYAHIVVVSRRSEILCQKEQKCVIHQEFLWLNQIQHRSHVQFAEHISVEALYVEIKESHMSAQIVISQDLEVLKWVK